MNIDEVLNGEYEDSVDELFEVIEYSRNVLPDRSVRRLMDALDELRLYRNIRCHVQERLNECCQADDRPGSPEHVRVESIDMAEGEMTYCSEFEDYSASAHLKFEDFPLHPDDWQPHIPPHLTEEPTKIDLLGQTVSSDVGTQVRHALAAIESVEEYEDGEWYIYPDGHIDELAIIACDVGNFNEVALDDALDIVRQRDIPFILVIKRQPGGGLPERARKINEKIEEEDECVKHMYKMKVINLGRRIKKIARFE